MSVVALDATVDLPPREAAVGAPTEISPRTRVLLHRPIVSTLLRMAWPNVLVMVAQAATGLIETWFVSKLGTDALAGMALVFPGVMLMQMISAGAMGGGISSAIARAFLGLPAMPFLGCRSFSRSSNCLKRSRSSARSIASGDVPRIGTSAASSAAASLSGV